MHDQPTYITVTKCLSHWGTSKFEEVFFAELSEQDQKLPLQGMCVSGGYPSVQNWPEFEDLKIVKHYGNSVSGNFAVSFTEEMNTSCRDQTFPERLSGRISFSMTLTTGEVEFESTALEKREYEKDEF